MDFDYGIIGGGPAGYTAGLALAKQGFKVIIFEKDKIGGTCLNRGCIPTKTLLHLSEQYRKVLDLEEFGLKIDISNFDFQKIVEKREKIIERIQKNLELALKNSKITIIYEEAKVINSMTILADKEYKVNNIIVATGSKPKEIKGLEYDNEFILSSDEMLKLNKLPKSILIVGSGAIGIESARIFSNFGVDTTIVEKEEHLIPTADIEVSKRIERIFKQHNIKIYTNDSIQKIYNKTVTLASGREVNPEVILIAIGRTPISFNTNQCQTIGDACGEIQLAHFAIHQAFNLTRFKSTSYDKNLIPFVIYGEPEIAWVGLREQDCDEKCDKIMLPISALGKSWCDDSTEGFIKIIVKEERIVGAHIVSKEASALIHQILIAMQNNINIDNLKKICFAHPTYSEGILETLLRL